MTKHKGNPLLENNMKKEGHTTTVADIHHAYISGLMINTPSDVLEQTLAACGEERFKRMNLFVDGRTHAPTFGRTLIDTLLSAGQVSTKMT